MKTNLKKFMWGLALFPVVIMGSCQLPDRPEIDAASPYSAEWKRILKIDSSRRARSELSTFADKIGTKNRKEFERLGFEYSKERYGTYYSFSKKNLSFLFFPETTYYTIEFEGNKIIEAWVMHQGLF